jgi:energy-coupling factor transporter ATP-binding protein EcfA2
MQVNARECRLLIPGAGVFYALDGRELWYAPVPGADERRIQTHLQGLPLAALLHQRGVLHFHAASFVFDGAGVLLLGQSGAGKSSLTAAFHQAGATALSDDLSAMVFEEEKPMIWPVDRQIRLRENTVQQLQLGADQLEAPDPYTGKYALKTKPHGIERQALDYLLHLEKHDGTNIHIEQPPAEEQFSLLRSEICHWEMLRGMPLTEKAYLGKILQMLNALPLLRVLRPEKGSISTLQQTIAAYLGKTIG